jgi:hypothetical protein
MAIHGAQISALFLLFQVSQDLQSLGEFLKLADASNIITYILTLSLSLSLSHSFVYLPYSDFGLTNDVSMKQLATDAAANAFDYVLHVG